MDYILFHRTYACLLVLLFIPVAFTTQAFATIDSPPTIDAVIVNPTSIDVFCTDPAISGGTIITGNVLEIYDGVYDGLGVDIDLSASDLICSFGTVNKISTVSLTDLSNYSIKLTVSTSDGNTFVDAPDFVQPDSNAAILVFKDLTADGPIIIQFRDIGVTNIAEPIISIPALPPLQNVIFTITDHNANANLASKETIIAKINGIDVSLEETGVNTGIFQNTLTAGATVMYNPGTQGFARATINIDFKIDPEDGLGLVGFAGNEKHDNVDSDGIFTPPETIYRDLDNSGTVSVGDIRLANAAETYHYIDGSVVVASDADESVPITAFASDEKHADSGAILNTFDKIEIVYKDSDTSNTVTVGDTRLANIKIGGYIDRSVVAADAFDGKADIIIEDMPIDTTPCAVGSFSPASHPINISFTHGGKASSNITVTMSSADVVQTIPSTDPSLLQMYYQGPGLAYGLVTALSDMSSHNAIAKNVISNPEFPFGLGPSQIYNDNINGDGTGLSLPMVQGSYVLGFDNGCGGGGGGGVSRGGFVQALGALAVFGGSSVGSSVGASTIGGAGPPSFSSSFLVKQDDHILSHDADPKLTESTKFKIGTSSTIAIGFSLPGGLGELEHVGLYTNIAKGQTKSDSDTYIYFDKYKTPQVTVHDPHGIFKAADVSVIEKDGRKLEAVFDFNFAKIITKNDAIVEVWNNSRDSAQVEIQNLVTVIGPSEPELKQDTVQPNHEEKQIRPDVPVWVKKNAGWWGQGQIDDGTFTNGIGYLIQNHIIDVPDLVQTNVSPEPQSEPKFSPVVPTWIKNTALWWSEDKLTDDDFLNGIKYLLENGIIKVRV